MDKVLIVDFGSQYTQLIARKIRELKVYSLIVPWQDSAGLKQSLETGEIKAIILSGGPNSAFDDQAPKVDLSIEKVYGQIPILGICYGMQILALSFKAQVSRALSHEYGHSKINFIKDSLLFSDIKQSDNMLNVWMSHGDQLDSLPQGFKIIASTDTCPIAAMENLEQQIFCLQFHPEVTHTDKGLDILKNFLFKTCQIASSWKLSAVKNRLVTQIQAKVGSRKVLLGLSGGVDSSVAAFLLEQAIGEQLVCVFVDNGLLRYEEAKQVEALFQNTNLHLIKVDAEEIFLKRLSGITDPEEKRKIIGKTFVDVFKERAARIKNIEFLAQGTIYPDVIESADKNNKNAKMIKSHHNVGGLPDNLGFKLLEPLRDFFKDEVRNLGLELGLPKAMVGRHPFPGPGLGVRILGEITKQKLDILRLADKIFIDTLFKYDLYDKISQAFVVFLSVKSVGVVGDARRYSYVLALRAVSTVDFMTAKISRIDYEILEEISSKIINSIQDVSRVVYDISSKPPATIEWE